MASQDLQFARQYDQWFMGKYQRELLDIDAGVYRYDQLIVLKMTRMPAVLLESGSIINRDEEVVMASQAHKDKVAAAVARRRGRILRHPRRRAAAGVAAAAETIASKTANRAGAAARSRRPAHAIRAQARKR